MTEESLAPLRDAPFASAIQKLEELLAQGGAAYLLGAGCSKCAGLPLTAELADKAAASTALTARSKAILGDVRAAFDGAKFANVEDYLSELIDLLAIAERRSERTGKPASLPVVGGKVDAAELRATIAQLKGAIRGLIHQPVSAAWHRRFVRAAQRQSRVGRRSGAGCIDYLILNYDTLIEDALSLERISHTDGLDGGETAWWNPAAFHRTDIAAKVLKLHGSVSWQVLANDPLPRRVGSRLNDAGVGSEFLIWPASTKYRETQLDPYAQLMNLARDAVSPSEGRQRVLVVCGYSFGDAHINSEIERGLRHSSGNLTVAAFSSDDKPVGPLAQWTGDPAISSQVLVFAKRGFFHGSDASESEADLPWWKFESLARLLEGER